MEEFPKLELHAHLNGSINRATVKKLLHLKAMQGRQVPDQARTCVESKESRNHDQIFEMFSLIHILSDNTKAVYTVTYDVIHDFAEDGVKYLELRTTPREVPETGMTMHSYIDTVLKAIHDCSKENLDIIVKLILSINRKDDIETAMKTVQLALQYKETSGGVVVGIDLSGKPTIGDARDFIPALKEAKSKGLKVTVHLSEAVNRNAETESVLREVLPHRIGHGVYLLPEMGGTQEIVNTVLTNKIPIELCLTSNLKCQLVESYEEHHCVFWIERNHPCVICTDDKGVFDTSLSMEYEIAAELCNLTQTDLWNMNFSNIDYIFADESIKEELRRKWQRMRPAEI